MHHRRVTAFVAAACLLFGIAACGTNDEQESSGKNPTRETAMTGTPELPPHWGEVVPATTVAGYDPVTKVSSANAGMGNTISVSIVAPGGSIKAAFPDPGQPQPTGPILDISLSNQLPVPTPAVVNDRIYAGSGYGSYFMNCLDAQTGAVIWTKPTQSDGPSAVACDGTYVAFCTESCTLEVMDAATGTLRWARWLGDPVPATPALVNGKVLAVYPDWGSYTPDTPLAGPVPFGQVASGSPGYSGSNWAVACFNATDGACNWVAPLPQHAITGPVVHGNTVFVATLDGKLSRIDLNSGAVQTQSNPVTTSAPTAYVDGNQVKVAFSQRIDADVTYECLRTAQLDGTLGAAIGTGAAPYLDTATVNASGYFGINVTTVLGTEQCYWLEPSWSTGSYPNVGIGSVFAMTCYEGSRPVVDNGNLYAAMGNRVVSYDLAGNLQWEYTHSATSWRLLNPPAFADGKLVLTDMEGAVIILNAANGQLLKSWETNYHFTQQPALAGGNIYAGTSNGHILIIPTGYPALDGWTQWGGNSGRNK